MNDTYARINNICLLILAATALTFGLSYMRGILVPFVFSVFIYFLSIPVIQFFKIKLKMPKSVAIGSTAFVFTLGLVILIVLIANSLEGFIGGLDIYKAQILLFIEDLNSILMQSQVPLDINFLLETVKDLPLMSAAKQVTGGVFSFLGNFVLIVIFSIFLLAGEGVREEPNNLLIGELEYKISRYIALKGAVSLVTAVLTLILLLIVNADLAFMFAVLTFLLNFIPNIGSIVAVVLPLPILMLQYGMGWQVLFFATTAMFIQFSIGNIIEPKLMGESMDLHPVVILIFLMFWGIVWGIPGMFLAVPITAIVKMVLARTPATHRISEILAGRI